MKFLFFNHLQNANDSLRSNRTRTALTITGVAIGIASIVAILSLGAGASRIVGDQVTKLGGNIALIRPSMPDGYKLEEVAGGQTQNTFATSSLSEGDVPIVRTVEHVEAVAPLMTFVGTVHSKVGSMQHGIIVGTTPDLIKTNQLKIASGQFLDDTANSQTAVIGAQFAIELFGTEEALGKTFNFRDNQFRVTGVLERQNTPLNYNGVDFDSAAFISCQAMAPSLKDAAQIQQINLSVDSIENLQGAIDAVSEKLSSAHRGEKDFSVLASGDIAQPTSQLFFAIAGAVAVIASISLIVGGVGIMNIMLVSVAERTREIGIRKAVGGTQSDIVWQFLIESLILSIIGGFVGIILGYALAFITSLFLTFNPALSWEIALIAMAVSALVGVVFGLYPAIRAARKDPIESLRQYN